MLAAVLRKAGHEIVEAADGSEAWRVLEDPQSPRLAILDWMMPEMDGIELVRKLREKQVERATYVVMLTARSDKADVISGLDAGADDYLAKPFELSELLARVRVGERMVSIQDRLAKQVQELTEAMDHIKTLQGIIPICAYCKSIRNDDGYWGRVEEYFHQHSDAQFSHGICPKCMSEHFPDIKMETSET